MKFWGKVGLWIRNSRLDFGVICSVIIIIIIF